MAIKGKKKSQKRGSSTKRRPAAAPRQAPVSRKVPWYRSPNFRVTALLGVIIVAAIVLVIVKNAQDNQAALQSRQDKIDNYTGQVRAVLQDVRGAATAMAAVPPADIPADQLKTLTKDSDGWVKSLEKAQAAVGKLAPTPGTTTTSTLYAQAVQLYVTAAKTYVLAFGLSGADANEVLARAGEVRAQGSTLWTQATTLLDATRAREEMDPSGLTAPETPSTTPGAAPGQLPPGQLPPGQLPPGQLPPGQLPPGQLPPGQLPPGVNPGQVPPGQIPPGQVPPGSGGGKGGGGKGGSSGKGSGGGKS